MALESGHRNYKIIGHGISQFNNNLGNMGAKLNKTAQNHYYIVMHRGADKDSGPRYLLYIEIMKDIGSSTLHAGLYTVSGLVDSFKLGLLIVSDVWNILDEYLYLLLNWVWALMSRVSHYIDSGLRSTSLARPTRYMFEFESDNRKLCLFDWHEFQELYLRKGCSLFTRVFDILFGASHDLVELFTFFLITMNSSLGAILQQFIIVTGISGRASAVLRPGYALARPVVQSPARVSCPPHSCAPCTEPSPVRTSVFSSSGPGFPSSSVKLTHCPFTCRIAQLTRSVSPSDHCTRSGDGGCLISVDWVLFGMGTFVLLFFCCSLFILAVLRVVEPRSISVVNNTFHNTFNYDIVCKNQSLYMLM